MSVKSQPFILLGVDLSKEERIRKHIIEHAENTPPYAKDDESEILYLVTEKFSRSDSESLYYLNDGMDGKYSILGVVVHHGDSYSGMEYKVLSSEEVEQIKSKCKSLFKEVFNIEIEPLFHFVTHWS